MKYIHFSRRCWYYYGGFNLKDEMDNKMPDGLFCTVHQGPAELYQEGFTVLGRLTDRWQTERCPWSSRLGVRLRADNPIPEKLHLLQKHWQLKLPLLQLILKARQLQIQNKWRLVGKPFTDFLDRWSSAHTRYSN